MASLVLGLFAFVSNHIDFARYLNILYIEGSGEIAVYLFTLVGAALAFSASAFLWPMLSTSSARIDEPGDYRTLTNAPHAAAKPAATSR